MLSDSVEGSLIPRIHPVSASSSQAIVRTRTVQTPVFQRFSSLLIGLGSAVVLSALFINPRTGQFYRSDVINYQDVLSTYFSWAMLLGLLMVANGLVLRWATSNAITSLSLMFATCALILLSRSIVARLFWSAAVDRRLGQSLQTPSQCRTVVGKVLRWQANTTNSYGHHDNDFPLKKGIGEFRGVMLGDSITMGHGVTREETFANQLEALLNSKSRTSAQIINAGVQGYATFQEYNAFLDSLVFEPNFVTIGFCMNDLVEPFVVDRRFGGVRVDYHGITQASSVLTSYLLNETGYGRLVQVCGTDRNPSK